MNEFHTQAFDPQAISFCSWTHEVVHADDAHPFDSAEQALSQGFPTKPHAP